jgi:hypothetical protein
MSVVNTYARRWLAPAFLILMLVCGPTTVMAQDSAPVIETASLRLWPEYDDPGLLVISAGSFGDSTKLPMQAAFPLPEGARGIQATVDDPATGLMNRQWEVVEGNLTYTLDLPDYHVEYYVDRLPSGEGREIRYTFRAPYRMKALKVDVQQPARATDFSVEPEPTDSYVGSDGFTYHTFTRADLAPGEQFDVTIRYNKQDDGLSTAGVAAPAGQAPAIPEQAGTPATGGAPDWLAYLLIGAGVLGVVAVAGYFLLQQRRSPVAPPNSRPSRPTVPAGSRSPRDAVTSEAGVFCTQCGRKFGADERFCAQCGTPRRS